MNLAFSAAGVAFRDELLHFLQQHCPPEAQVTRDRIGTDDVDDNGVRVIPAWARARQATLFDQGWKIPSCPPELGGRNATPTQALYEFGMDLQGSSLAVTAPAISQVAGIEHGSAINLQLHSGIGYKWEHGWPTFSFFVTVITCRGEK